MCVCCMSVGGPVEEVMCVVVESIGSVRIDIVIINKGTSLLLFKFLICPFTMDMV